MKKDEMDVLEDNDFRDKRQPLSGASSNDDLTANIVMMLAGIGVLAILFFGWRFLFSGSGEENPFLTDKTEQVADDEEPSQDSDPVTTADDSQDDVDEPADDSEDEDPVGDEGDGEDEDGEDGDTTADNSAGTDEVLLKRASVSGSNLKLDLSYSGCGPHDFALNLDEVDTSGSLPKLVISVSHDGNGDCEPSLETQEEFDISDILSQADSPNGYTLMLVDTAGKDVTFDVR